MIIILPFIIIVLLAVFLICRKREAKQNVDINICHRKAFADYDKALEQVEYSNKIKTLIQQISEFKDSDPIFLSDECMDNYPWSDISYSIMSNPDKVTLDYDNCPNCGKNRVKLWYVPFDDRVSSDSKGCIFMCPNCRSHFGLRESEKCTDKIRYMLEEYKYIPKQGKLTALCRTVHDGWNNLDLPQLTIGESYTVEYAIICSSRTFIGLSAFPKETFNSAQFSFYLNDDAISLIWDYCALKRLMNDDYRGTTIVIYDGLSAERISEIKQRYNTRVLIRSEII